MTVCLKLLRSCEMQTCTFVPHSFVHSTSDVLDYIGATYLQGRLEVQRLPASQQSQRATVVYQLPLQCGEGRCQARGSLKGGWAVTGSVTDTEAVDYQRDTGVLLSPGMDVSLCPWLFDVV